MLQPSLGISVSRLPSTLHMVCMTVYLTLHMVSRLPSAWTGADACTVSNPFQAGPVLHAQAPGAWQRQDTWGLHRTAHHDAPSIPGHGEGQDASSAAGHADPAAPGHAGLRRSTPGDGRW